MEDLKNIQSRINDIYNRVFNGDADVLVELDDLIVETLKYDSQESSEVNDLLNTLIEKINLIYEMLEIKKDNLITIDMLKEEFKILEYKRFEIENNYVMGILKIDDIENFRNILFNFRKKLYAIPISDNNILEIAKMKSKVQHFDTDISEDEDILQMAYANSN